MIACIRAADRVKSIQPAVPALAPEVTRIIVLTSFSWPIKLADSWKLPAVVAIAAFVIRLVRRRKRRKGRKRKQEK